MSQIHLQEPTIVLRGSFNPSIFQPSWLVLKKLISDEDAKVPAGDESKVVITDQVAQFPIRWADLLVTRDRFQLMTKDLASESSLCDLALGVFAILDEVPLTVMGINRLVHVRLADQDEANRVWDKLVPSSTWDSILQDPLPRSLQMTARRPDDYPGQLIVTLTPSDALHALGWSGFLINVNHQFDLPNGQGGNPYLLELLRQQWQGIQRSSETLASRLIERALEQG